MRHKDHDSVALVCPECGYASSGTLDMICPQCESKMVADDEYAAVSAHPVDIATDGIEAEDESGGDGEFVSLERARDEEFQQDDLSEEY